MSHIDPHQWAELGPLLDRALELTAEAREAWLHELAAQSPELAASLTALLSADARADERGFLAESPAASLAGRELGHYTLIRPLGHGGMGSVWLARRTDGRFEGLAAVKLMSLALMGETGQARFRREGTALARLRHPAIGRLLDAGVAPSGQPYLVLEYVDGQHIDVHADAARLSQHQRIELILQVLDAVVHAHANLVVHRDLKPSNILVTAEGQVKLLDFGIAKLLQEDGEDARTALTSDGAGALTLDYASPEQLRGEDITTATDIYALGVLLYLLLSGRHPTRGPHPTPAEAVHGILQVEPRPLGLGDLDTIIAKALRKSPAERYATAATLADDLRRYLRDEPVSARPDSLGYRARKFVRRNRSAVAAAVVMAIVLIGSTAFSVVQARRAAEQRDVAVRSARRATAMTELQAVLAGDNRGADGKPLTTAERIALAEEVLVAQFGSEPWLVSEVLIDLSTRLGESMDRTGERALLARAAAIARAGKQPEQLALASCARSTSFWVESLNDSASAELSIAKAALARAGSTVDPIVRSRCLEAEGKALEASGQGDSAVTLLRQAVALFDDKPTDSYRLGMITALSELLRLTNHHREAAALQQKVVRDLVGVGLTNAEAFPNVLTFLDRTLADLGELHVVDSIVGGLIREREAAAGSSRVPLLMSFLHGMNKQRLGEIDSADHWLGRAMAVPWQQGGTMGNWLPSTLAQVRVSQGRLAEARAAAANLPSGTRGRRATGAMVRALILHAEGRPAAALQLLEREMTALYAESPVTQSLFTLPLVTAGELRLAAGDAHAADSLAQLGWRAAALDSLAQTRSALAGRADLLRARALRQLGDTTALRMVTARAIAALTNGSGPTSAWTRAARAFGDSLAR
ncbi:MAG: serine/threonine protein kinase [Gemmatimonadetes bacterium]|nr:serine/threonine protein kinase [Gemmatimonadota bacterium]